MGIKREIFVTYYSRH